MQKITFILFFVALSLGVCAQTTGTTGYWDLRGNTGTEPRFNFIGTSDNQPLIFKTNGVERMRLLTGGSFFGIGIPTPQMPQATLHLHYQNDWDNNPSFPQLLQLTSPTCTTGFNISFNRDTKDLHFKQQESAKFFLEGVGGGFVIAPDGNVGYGTDAPKVKVDVAGSFKAESAEIEGILSAAEVNVNGVNLGEMNTMLLQKMEELTQSITYLQKQIDELKSR